MRTVVIRHDFERPISVLGVDPGLTATGFAVIRDGTIELGTFRSKGRDLPERVCQIRKAAPVGFFDVLCVEHMKVYTDGPGDPQDLINLALIEGAIVGEGRWSQCLLPSPGAWSRGVPKKIRHDRLRARFGPLKGVSEHALDALGLALYGMDNAKKR